MDERDRAAGRTIVTPIPTQRDAEPETLPVPNRFELRLVERCADEVCEIRGQISLDAEIWVDGVLLDEPHFIDLPMLVQSLHESRWFDIFTCGCGVGMCAGIVDGIQVTHRGGLVDWSFRRPQSAGNLLDPALSEWEKTAVPVSFTFDKAQMLAAIEAFLDVVRAEVGTQPERFSWPVHGFTIADLLRLDPTKPYFDSFGGA